MQPSCVSGGPGPHGRERRRRFFVLAVAASAALCVAGVLGVMAGAAGAVPTARAKPGSRTSVVWLCRPGAKSDPCAFTRAATSVPTSGPRTPAGLTTVHPPATGRFDCFFVYPTVSTQRADNANLDVQSNEIAAAIDEASVLIGHSQGSVLRVH